MKVLLLKAGETSASVRLAHGDYDRWFLETASQPGVQFEVLPIFAGAPLPDRPEAYDAIWMTGSPFSVTAPEPWMLAAAEFLKMAGQREVPVLGVCFGLQLLSLAYGGKVARNPRGREIGTIEVDLTDAGARDPLFAGLPRRIAVQATHEDEVTALPEGATLLASNAMSGIQAFAVGPRTRAVQFHPELQPAAMRAAILARAEKLDSEAQARGAMPGERVPALLQGVRATPFGRRILHNFLDFASEVRRAA